MGTRRFSTKEAENIQAEDTKGEAMKNCFLLVVFLSLFPMAAIPQDQKGALAPSPQKQSSAGFPGSRIAEAADLILSDGEIYTPDGWAQSLAVRNGAIIAVGEDELIKRFRSPQTRVIELHGDTVVPGLHDMHVHPMSAGMARRGCNFPQGSSPQQIVDTVKSCVAEHAKGEWITGGQWDAASFGKQGMHRSLLDSVSPDNPVVLSDISGHSAFANSKALQISGITGKTPNPPGGIIEREENGEPTGVLRESAAGLVRGGSSQAPLSPDDRAKGLIWALSTMLSYGITSFTDAAIDESSMQLYADLSDKGVLKQRVRGCIMWSPMFNASQDSPFDPTKRRNLYTRDRFKADCVKIILDGVPTDGHTAAMVESYADASNLDEARAKGMLLIKPEVLNAAVIEFDRQGLTVKFHAAGDAAVREGLDAIEAARKANGFSGNLHNTGHNSFVQMSDFRRARDIQATFEMSPYIWYPNPIIPDIAKAIGPERMKRWTPVKDAIDSGALVVPGSDWNVVPSVDPWIAIETLVTRRKPGGGGEALGEAEKITLKQAFDLYTVNSTRHMGNASKTGSIERGMLADILVLDRNPFKIPVTQIHNTKVKLTLIDGEIVYQAPDLTEDID
jgi:predicted amidohydrolase YtcJ